LVFLVSNDGDAVLPGMLNDDELRDVLEFCAMTKGDAPRWGELSPERQAEQTPENKQYVSRYRTARELARAMNVRLSTGFF
jgi:hypothetical protein